MADADEPQGKNLNAEIRECRKQLEFWTNKLEKLEAKKRHEFLLARIADDPVSTWNELPVEEESKDIVLALLAHDPHFFGECPWAFEGYFHDLDDEPIRPDLPEKFCEDRDIILAYARGEHYEEDYGEDLCETYGYDIPECVADDKEVVLVMCSKHWPCLESASLTLRNDKEVILAAIREGGGGGGWNSCNALEYASERLRGDMDVLLTAVQNTEYSFSWLSFALFTDVESEKKVALAVAKQFPTMDSIDTWYEEECSPLPHFSQSVLDDEQIMLEFLKVTGYCLKWSSDRLRSNAKLVKAAVKTKPSSVEFSLGKVRKELLSDREFMISALKDGGGGMLVYCPEEMQKDRSIVLEAVANGLAHRNVPKYFRSDREIALEPLKKYGSKLSDLDASVRVDKSFALDALKINCNHLYRELPDALLCDEEIALYILRRDTGMSHFVFEKNAALLGSEEAMTIVVESKLFNPTPLCRIVQRCRFVDNKKFMLNACRHASSFLQCASEQLRSDRDVVKAAFSSYHAHGYKYPLRDLPFAFVPEDFQLANIDITVKAIEILDVKDIDRFLEVVAAGVWSHRDVVLAWLERGFAIFEHLKTLESSFFDDRALIRLAVKNDWSEFQYADTALREDRDFVLSVLKIDGRAYLYVDDELQDDYELLTVAIANTSTTITSCFDDDGLVFLFSYATHVRDKLGLFEDIFVRGLLCGISTTETRAAPTKSCLLQTLDQGPETTIVFKRTIAEFLGVPLGEELLLLRAASAGLAKCGF